MNDEQGADELRRSLIMLGGASLGGALLATSASGAARAAGAGFPGPKPVDEGSVAGTRVDFPPIDADTERPGGPPPNPDAPSERVGFAVMGLGRLALENILPAFAQCKHAKPVALISGDPVKMAAVAAQYGIAKEACYGYGDIAKLRGNRAIEVVYVVLPNALHRDAVVQLAHAGKHVLCEKPMATNPEEARDMVAACRQAARKLMIAYRCQYETYNRELTRRARAGDFGQIQFIDAVNTQNQGDPLQWRQVQALAGGGSLPDVGLYCLNGTRALLGEEPIELRASIHSPPDDPRFKEVESTVSFTLRFPSGVIANCVSSYSAHEHRNLRVMGAKGSAELLNAFSYAGQKLRISRRDDRAESTAELSFAGANQFSLELDHMAHCVRHDLQPRTPGEEGLQDQVLMAALYESARTGNAVKLTPVAGLDPFRGAAPDPA